MCVPVNRECCCKAWVSTSTATECAMRIGPLKAEVAAERGREKRDLDEIDLCWAGTALLLAAEWARFSHRRKKGRASLTGEKMSAAPFRRPPPFTPNPRACDDPTF